MCDKMTKRLKFRSKKNIPEIKSIQIPATPTEKLENTLNQFWKSGQLLNTVPFHFDTSRNALIPSPLFPHRLVWLTFILLYLLDVLYMLQIRHTVSLDKVSEDEFVNFYVHFITRLVAGVLLIYLAFNTFKISQFTMFLFTMIKKCEFDAFGAKHFQYFFRACLIFVHVQPLFPLILHLQSRHSARYWPSQFIANDIYDSICVATIYALLDLTFSSIAIWATLYIILPVMCYIFFGQHWMQKLR